MNYLDTQEGSALLKNYLRQFGGKSSEKVYRSEIKQFFKFYSGKLTDLDRADFHRYLEQMSDVRAETVKRKFSIINRFLKFAETQVPGFVSPIGGGYGDLKAFSTSDYSESEVFHKHLNSWKETLICESTKTTYSGHARLFFSWLAKEPGQVVKNDFTAYRDFLINERKLKNSTIWNRFVALNGFFKFLSVKSRKIKNHINFKELKLVPPRKDTGYYSVLTEEEIRLLLQQPDTELMGKRDSAMLHLMCIYGLRAGEVGKLRFGDIEMERYQGQQKIWIRDRKGHIGRRKHTDIILNGRALEAFDDWLDNCHFDFKSDTPVFLPFFYDRFNDRIRLNRKRAEKKQPLTVQTVENVVDKYVSAADLKTGNRAVSPHALRHSAFTILARAGIKIIDLKWLAAHESVSTTQIYLHAVQSYDDNVGMHSPVNR
ncbi:tyrosine-type recombinase/integrase [Desulfococcaceae bacterium HSG8]|nr:tyrosine-type recombinase/integrase [Desulfococcaceae bacterium HSG8]